MAVLSRLLSWGILTTCLPAGIPIKPVPVLLSSRFYMSVSAFPRVCDRLRKHSFRFGLFAIGYCCISVFTSERVLAQATTFGGNAQHTSISVSYTHLRAHETGRNL